MVFVAVVAFAAHMLPTPRNVDDSFITFRYSRNLVNGEGFVYNPGVRTLGTTTPLYALTMAGAAFVTQGENFPWYALVINSLADAANAALLFWLVRRATGSLSPAVVIGLLWAVAPLSVTFAVSGMETSVNILWMLAAFAAFLDDRRWWVGVFAGLGLLTRPDAALWILPLGLWQLAESLRERRIPWQTWLGGALTIAPWVIFSVWYFGSPLPNSLGAKTVAYNVEPFGALQAMTIYYTSPFLDFDTVGSLRSVIIGMVLYPTLNLLALIYLRRREPRLIAFLLYPWLYFAVFAVVNPLMFRWYFLPPMPAWIFGAVVGVWSLAAPLAARLNAERVVYPAVAALMLGWWGFLSLNHWTLTPTHGPSNPAPAAAWHELELHYQEIGTQLHDEFGVTPETRVASADIGAIGYFSGATIVDTVGLVTPELSEYYPFDPAIRVDDQNYAVPPALILDTQPEYFVTMEAFVRQGLQQTPAFIDNYTLVREIPTGYYGTGVQLYARNDVLANAR